MSPHKTFCLPKGIIVAGLEILRNGWAGIYCKPSQGHDIGRARGYHDKRSTSTSVNAKWEKGDRGCARRIVGNPDRFIDDHREEVTCIHDVYLTTRRGL